MTCDEFNAAAFRVRGPAGNPQMITAMYDHTATCEPCSRVFMELIKRETEKQFALPAMPVDPPNKEPQK